MPKLAGQPDRPDTTREESIFTTWTNRDGVRNGALLTRALDAVDANDFQFRRSIGEARSSAGMPCDGLLRGIESACLCRNVR